MKTHLYINSATRASAWVESGLEGAFPGSFERLLALAGDPERLRGACDEILAKWEQALDTEAIEHPDEP